MRDTEQNQQAKNLLAVTIGAWHNISSTRYWSLAKKSGTVYFYHEQRWRGSEAVTVMMEAVDAAHVRVTAAMVNLPD